MRLVFTLLLIGCAGLASAAEPSLDYPDHSRLLVYRDDAGQEHPVSSPQDWAIRRQHILAGMQAVMGPAPDRTDLPPLDVQVSSETIQEGVRRLNLTYQAAPGERVPAILYLPADLKAGQRRAAVLALHPTGPLGKDIVAGLGPRANRGYGLELAQRGYIVLAPDYPSFGDLANHDFAADRYESGTMQGVFYHMRGVDLLCQRPEVDAARIGVIGHSLGGHNALFVAAFDERLKVTVSSCGWTPFHDYYKGALKGWAQDCYMPRVREQFGLDADRMPFDFYEVLASLAPRAFFSVSPVGDSNFEVAGVRKAEPLVREVYDLLSASDALQIRYPDCEHDFPPASRREAYAFMDGVLSHEPTAIVPADE